ncbi:hypothetical protein IVB38_14990 [Bradyrhizobium sp. 38]|jgi:hypothetical protein|uniref:hypothetical protein n=1 Tax=unclassified Bradyrhizobium TaxID=2631580 RepID=UPI001FF805AB|nr:MULTISPECIES: hypothetical protein [unclassified Bradyrhizobium]MCK1337299.1 hypothetical protein [Bradyrhizobium sp. 38]MCK1777081.1 hypothetical protein [Bradyrhizobium sp. 132]
MTTPAPETIEREQGKLWVSDAEMIRRLGVPEKVARAALRMLDRDPKSGFPRKQILWGERRYRPAIVAYFDQHYALPGGGGEQAKSRMHPHGRKWATR